MAQVVEFQPKLGAVVTEDINTPEKLKDLIVRIVDGDGEHVGLELSQRRLAELMVAMIDLAMGGSGDTGTVLPFRIHGNKYNTPKSVQDLTGTEVIGILPDFIGSGPNHARGVVPDPGAVASVTRYLREDGQWVVPPNSGGGGLMTVEVDNTIIRYEVKSGAPNVSASRTGGVQTITVTDGTINLISVCTLGVAADLAGDNSFKIVCNGVIGTTLLAYPTVQKWNLSGIAPSDMVPHVADIDNTPQVQITAGTAGTSITARIINLNAFTNWAIKMTW